MLELGGGAAKPITHNETTWKRVGSGRVASPLEKWIRCFARIHGYIYIYLSMRPSHRDFLPSPIPFIRSRCVIFSNEAKVEGEVLSNSLSGRLAVKIWQGEIAGGG